MVGLWRLHEFDEEATSPHWKHGREIQAELSSCVVFVIIFFLSLDQSESAAQSAFAGDGPRHTPWKTVERWEKRIHHNNFSLALRPSSASSP